MRVTGAELNARPITRPGELLEATPGLVVTQHSGEGKANQYFLRGYNLDHGTDLAIWVDDMPINMRTHAHGQGYADMNWLMPETVNSLAIRKGPYFADEGDFASAGNLRIGLVDSGDAAQRRGQSQPVFPARLQSRSRHRPGDLGRRHADQHAHPCAWPGLCRSELADAGNRQFARRSARGRISPTRAISARPAIFVSASSTAPTRSIAQLTARQLRLPATVRHGLDQSRRKARCCLPARSAPTTGRGVNPDDVRKVSGMVRYSQGTATDGFSLTGMAYTNKWNSTDQVPLRAIASGQIGRFDAEDPTDGGNTDRFSLSARIAQTDDVGSWKANAYVVKSSLDLFNNFTYFLTRSDPGRPVPPARRPHAWPAATRREPSMGRSPACRPRRRSASRLDTTISTSA